MRNDKNITKEKLPRLTILHKALGLHKVADLDWIAHNCTVWALVNSGAGVFLAATVSFPAYPFAGEVNLQVDCYHCLHPSVTVDSRFDHLIE